MRDRNASSEADASIALQQVLGWSDEGTTWVFAYGSLIWAPVGSWTRRERATLRGYHRSFCIGSRHYRGTPEQPGALLGLVPGGSCVGVAYQLAEPGRRDALRDIVGREMPSGTSTLYRPRRFTARLQTRELVQALVFVADRRSAHFEQLADEEVARRIRTCGGRRGTNLEYALRTEEALYAAGIKDRTVARVMELARRQALDRCARVASDHAAIARRGPSVATVDIKTR